MAIMSTALMVIYRKDCGDCPGPEGWEAWMLGGMMAFLFVFALVTMFIHKKPRKP